MSLRTTDEITKSFAPQQKTTSDVCVPEIDLENGMRLNEHAYRVSPTFRELIDRLRAKGRAEEQRWFCTRWFRAATMLRDEERPWRCWPTLKQVLETRKLLERKQPESAEEQKG